MADQIRFHREFNFIEPGGRVSKLRPGVLSFARIPFLSISAKIAIVRALAAIKRDWDRRPDLDRITMLDWLNEKSQPPDAIAHFWRPVLVSALNAELDVMAARHGLQVFRLASIQMALAAAPLEKSGAGEHPAALPRGADSIPRRRGHRRATPRRAAPCRLVRLALPFERIGAVAPELGLDLSAFRHSPITSIHLWFDRSITDLPHAALLDRTIQWLFNMEGGRYVQLVVSASNTLVEMPRNEVIALALAELAEFLPEVRAATLEKAPRHQGNPGNLRSRPRTGSPAARRSDSLQQPLPGRRLDPPGLALDYGRRSPQRLPGRRSADRRRG